RSGTRRGVPPVAGRPGRRSGHAGRRAAGPRLTAWWSAVEGPPCRGTWNGVSLRVVVGTVRPGRVHGGLMTINPGGAPLSIADGVRVFAAAQPTAPAVVDGDQV